MVDHKVTEAPNGANMAPADDVAMAVSGNQYVTVGTLRTTIRGAALGSIAGLTTAADQGIYTTAANTYATTALTAVGRAFWAAADPGANRGWYWNDTAGEIRPLTFGSGLKLDTGTNTLAASGSTDSGDMLASTYDPAGVSEQLVGLTATQALTNKTLDADSNTIRANKIRETSGPTVLTVGAVADGQMVVRLGTTLVGQAVPSGSITDLILPARGSAGFDDFILGART